MNGYNPVQLSEYEKAIDSAHHYDQIGWIITSISFVFLGVLIGASKKLQNLSFSLKGLLLLAFTIFWIHVGILFIKSQYNKIKRYGVAWEISEPLGIGRTLRRPENPLWAYANYILFMFLFWVVFYFILFNP